MAEGRCDQQPLQLREAGKACGDGFPVSSNTVNRNTTFQLGRDYLVRDICQKKKVTVPTQDFLVPARISPVYCYHPTQGGFVILVSTWGDGCPSFASTITTDQSCWLKSPPQPHKAVRGYPGQIFGSLNTFGGIQHWRA